MSASRRETKALWYKNNKAKVHESQRKYRQTAKGRLSQQRASRKNRKASNRAAKARLRALIDDAKRRPCMDCGGVFDTVCMDFDHRPDEAKRFSISEIRYRYISKSVVLAEIAKCDVVCANCHRVRTYRKRDHGARCNGKAPEQAPSRQTEMFTASK